MKIIQPKTEYWDAPEDWKEQVARAAGLCYAAESSKLSADEMCAHLTARGHFSMFRHGSAYFVVEMDGDKLMPGWMYSHCIATPYVGIFYQKAKGPKGPVHRYYVSTNRQYLMEHKIVSRNLAPHEVTRDEFIRKIKEYNYPRAYQLLRYTVCVTTQISTSRELNRTSPNAIAEQSTRYVNFGKRGGITICEPHWWATGGGLRRFIARAAWRFGGFAYRMMLKFGAKPEDARGVLPLDAATRVAYTYNVYEWRHIMALRLTGETGRPHPNAKIAAQQINDLIVVAMRELSGNENVGLVRDMTGK